MATSLVAPELHAPSRVLAPGIKFEKRFRLVKVDEASHTAYGLATSEAVDCEGEIADYEGSKEAFSKWSQDFMNRTQSAGQDLSLGNIRIQHNAGEIGGKATRIDFRDDAKEVYVESVPINDEVWDMLQGGFLTGYSIGGRVLKVKKEGKHTRYWFSLSELSYVDNPANPDATFAYVKMNGSVEIRKFRRSPETIIDDVAASAKKTAQDFAAAANSPEGAGMALFTADQLAQIEHVILKKDGKTKHVAGEDLPSSAFAFVGDKDDPSTWKLPLHFSSEEKSQRHVRNALARMDQTKDIPDDKKESVRAKIVAAAKKYGIDVEGEKAKADAFCELVKTSLHKSLGADEVKKSMWSIGVLAEILESLSYLYYSCIQEAMWEEDDRDGVLAVELAAAVEHLVVILKDMVEEETSELIPALKAAQQELKLLKGERSMVEILNIGQEFADLQKAGLTTKASLLQASVCAEKMAAHHEKEAADHAASAVTHKDDKVKADEYESLRKQAAAHGEASKSLAATFKALAEKAETPAVPAAEPVAKAAEPAAVAAVAAPAATAAAAVADPTLASVLLDLKKSIDTSNDTSAKLQKSFEDFLAAPQPVGTPTPVAKAAGLELVGRTGPTPIAKAAEVDRGI